MARAGLAFANIFSGLFDFAMREAGKSHSRMGENVLGGKTGQIQPDPLRQEPETGGG
jgi:hypothetical protein